MLDLIIKNGLCYIEGKLKKQDIGIINGKISSSGHYSEIIEHAPNNVIVYNHQPHLIMPGFIVVTGIPHIARMQ